MILGSNHVYEFEIYPYQQMQSSTPVRSLYFIRITFVYYANELYIYLRIR